MHLMMRIIGELIVPPYGLVILSLFGILLIGRFPRLGRLIAIAPIVLLFVLSMPIIPLTLGTGHTYYAYKEEPFPPADAIVILGGGRRPNALEYETPETVGCGTLERLRYGARLARRYQLPILVTGGRPHLGTVRGHNAEGDLMRDVLESEYGLPVRWVENQSDDTIGNARLSAPLLHADGIKRIYLVTHADHAARAGQLFEAEGFEVVTTPTHFVPPPIATTNDWIPSFGGLGRSRALLYDWLNRLRG